MARLIPSPTGGATVTLGAQDDRGSFIAIFQASLQKYKTKEFEVQAET
jgi:hypothetical protein